MANITFVDEKDNVIGYGSKREAWDKGIAHRVARIFLFNSKGELLIQKRADNCESLPGRWDQSAAGHVDEGETYLEAAQREMEEEVGIKGIELREISKNYTDEKDEADKIKKRFATTYIAEADVEPKANLEEVSEVRWINPDELETWMDERPDDFTAGFMLNFKKLREQQK